MLIIAVVTYVYPWQEIVSGHVRTEVAFERTFGSHQIAQLILFGAFLSLLKIFNGNFVGATRMLYAIGRRNLVHPSLGRVHATFGTPVVAISLMAALTAAAAMFGDAILVPITEVGSLAVGVGWLSACVGVSAAAARRPRRRVGVAGDGLVRRARSASAIILMKVVPSVPGSFTRPEWIAFAAWSAFGLVFWLLRPDSLIAVTTETQTAETREKHVSLRFLAICVSRFLRSYTAAERLLDELVLREPAENLDLSR